MHVTTCPSSGAPLGWDVVLTLTLPPPLPSHPIPGRGRWWWAFLLAYQDKRAGLEHRRHATSARPGGGRLAAVASSCKLAHECCHFILNSLSISTVLTPCVPSLAPFLSSYAPPLAPTCASCPHSHSVSQTHSHVMCGQSLPPSPVQSPTPLIPSPCSPAPVTPLLLLDH